MAGWQECSEEKDSLQLGGRTAHTCEVAYTRENVGNYESEIQETYHKVESRNVRKTGRNKRRADWLRVVGTRLQGTEGDHIWVDIRIGQSRSSSSSGTATFCTVSNNTGLDSIVND